METSYSKHHGPSVVRQQQAQGPQMQPFAWSFSNIDTSGLLPRDSEAQVQALRNLTVSGEWPTCQREGLGAIGASLSSPRT